MKIRLGYISNPLQQDGFMYSRTMTYTNYKKLGEKAGNQKLDNIIQLNFQGLNKVLEYNKENEVHFYRLFHKLIPLATHRDVKFEYIKKYKKQWREIGDKIKNYQIRVDTHPDQYCVLNSMHEEVIDRSIEILQYNYDIFQAMGIEGKTVLHIGSSAEGKEASLLRFKKTFEQLPNYLKKLIMLENDDKVFQVEDVLSLCETLKIPMILDYHHYQCNHQKHLTKKEIKRIYDTWKTIKLNPKMHFSSPKNKKEFRSHSEYVAIKEFLAFMKCIKIEKDMTVDVMLECKARDKALFALCEQLKEDKKIVFKDRTSFAYNRN